MGRRRTGWTREKDGIFYVGLTLRSGKSYEKPVPAPPDGLPIDDNYLGLVCAKLVRAYESGSWDPEAPEEPVAAVPENPAFAEHLRRFTGSRTYESAEKDRRRVEVYLAASPVAAVPVRELKPAHALTLITFLQGLPSRRGGKLGASAVRSIFDVCLRALDVAVMHELLPSNPFRLGPVRAELPRKRHKDPKARRGWWFRREEVEQLLCDPRIEADRRVMYAVLFLTGMRFGELAALRFGDWDRAARPFTRITVSLAIKSVSKTEGATKTEAEKQVPVHPALEGALVEWFERGWARYMGRAPTAEDYVIPSVRGRRKGAPRNSSTANRTFRDDCVTLGLRSRHMYCARHTFITLTQEDGGDGTVLRWITHAPPSTAYDGYSREQWGRLCRELGKLQITGRTKESPTPGEATRGEAAEDTLEDTLDLGEAPARNPSNQGTSGGSTEESNLPRDA
jgi:integrase